MRALVTGGGGFIGSHLASRLLAMGADVRVLDNFATGRRSNLLDLEGQVEIVEGDIQSYERVHNAVRGCDVVFHQAALPSVPRSIQDPLTSNATNIVGTLNVLLAARDEGVKRVVFASSSSVYGANPRLPKCEDDATMPISPYGVTKLAAEGYCRSFGEVYGLETVSLRYFNVFGPRQNPLSEYAAVVPKFISRMLAEQPPTIYGDGEQSRDFTFVDDVIAANLLAMDAEGVTGRVFNIACGNAVTVNGLLAELRGLIGGEIEPEYVDAIPGEVRASLADISSAREQLGFDPQVSLREGLVKTIAHLRGEPLGVGFGQDPAPARV
jgi:UDP-glucose 4-epimerase